MPKFKVGDRVICVEKSSVSDDYGIVGEIYTVSHVRHPNFNAGIASSIELVEKHYKKEKHDVVS